MKAPQILVLGFDDWLAKQVKAIAVEHRWLLHDVRQANAIKPLLKDRISVLFAQVDPHGESSPGLKLLAEIHDQFPDVRVVIVSDGKLPDAERSVWTAAVMGLGASFVLFPPLTTPVLEDLAGGLMSALVPRAESDVIDLAEEGTEP